MGVFHLGTERWDHLAREQIDGGILTGGRKIGAPCQGADKRGHFTRGQKDWSTLPGGRWLGVFHQGIDSLEHLARGQIFRGRKIGASCPGMGYGLGSCAVRV